MKKIKIAVLGCGRVSKTAHYDAIRTNPNYEFVAVCDIDETRANKWAKFNKVKPYYNLETLLEKEKLDLIAINTPNGLHAKQGIIAANGKVNVLVEKPMAMTIKDADNLIDTCEKNKVKLFVVKQNRFNATNMLLKSCIDKGRFGNLTTCNVTVSWRRELNYYMEDNEWRSKKNLAGGVFTNQSVHYIDMMQWLIGSPPETVYAKMATAVHPVEVENYGVGIIKFKNGVIGSLVLSNLSYPTDVEGSITIIGETGMVKIGGKSMNKVILWDFKDDDKEDELIKKADTSPPTVYGFGHNIYYKKIAQYLLHDDCEQDIIDGKEGRKSVALLHALYLSNQFSKEIHFPIGKR